MAPLFWLFRGLASLLLLAYFVLALAILVTRYVLLPNLDQYVPQIERAVAQTLGLPVRIGGLSAQWYRLNPEIILANVQVLDEQGREALALPFVQARLSWRSLLSWQPQLLSLQLDRPALAVRRDARDILHVAGVPLLHMPQDGLDSTPSADTAWRAADHPFADWLLDQPQIVVREASLTWHDDTGRLPDLALDVVNLRFQAGLFGSAQFALEVPGAFAGGRDLAVRAAWQRQWLSARSDGVTLGAWAGRVYVALAEVDLAVLRPWLGNVSPTVLEGQAAGRLWWDFEGLQWSQVRGDLALRNASWSWQPGDPALALADARAEVLARPTAAAARWRLQDAVAYLPDVFADPAVPIHELTGTLARSRTERGDWVWTARDVALDAGEPGRRAHMTGEGSWREQTGLALGWLQVDGQIVRGDAGAVARLMPREVAEGVRDWLQQGLRAGQVEHGAFRVRGDLSGFPFAGPDAERGEFWVAGRVRDVAIDLVPGSEPGWPLLTGLQGELQIEGDHLSADIERGEVRVGEGPSLRIGTSRLDIPDMTTQARVLVDTQVSGAADSYLAYLRASPLAENTAALSGLQIDGQLIVPLSVAVPLAEDGAPSVLGTLRFDGNAVRVEGLPAALEQVTGQVQFTESTVTAPMLRGRFLGVGVEGRGTRTEDGAIEAGVNGRFPVATLALTPWQGLESWLEGSLPLQADYLRSAQGAQRLEIHSNLTGLRSRLPAPLGKSAEAEWPSQLTWQVAGDEQSPGLLQVTLGDRLRAEAELRGAFGLPPRRMAVGLPGPVALPPSGWHLALQQPEINLDDWREMVTHEAVSGGGVTKALTPVTSGDLPLPDDWPRPLQVELATQSLVLFDRQWPRLTARLEVADEAVARLRLESEAVAGWLGWRPETPAGPARLEARLERLRLPQQQGETEPPTSPAPEREFDWGDPAQWPHVDLDVEDLRWGDRALGVVSLLAEPDPVNASWLVTELTLENPAIRLAGQGRWALGTINETGAASETEVEFAGSVLSAGDLLKIFGVDDVVSGGHGEVSGKAVWPGAPWTLDVEDVDAELDLVLDDGRFLPVSATAGRLLGILSLQSLARSVAFQGKSVFESGFAWDTLRADAQVRDAQLHLRAFEMRGQSAAAFLSGHLDLSTETQDLHALILPRIDASGAALLAGVAINPLVGLGAFVGQLLLREPLAQLFSLEYAITGSWAEPRVERLRQPDPPPGDPLSDQPLP